MMYITPGAPHQRSNTYPAQNSDSRDAAYARFPHELPPGDFEAQEVLARLEDDEDCVAGIAAAVVEESPASRVGPGVEETGVAVDGGLAGDAAPRVRRSGIPSTSR